LKKETLLFLFLNLKRRVSFYFLEDVFFKKKLFLLFVFSFFFGLNFLVFFQIEKTQEKK
jgi:hypothetical protein